jgi:tetratricopeptide (TPR) repeat protein
LRFALALLVFTTSCSQWRSSFDKGLEAFRHARYADAAGEFERAAASKPDSLETRLYLGATYPKQHTPGSPASKNAEMNFRKALELDAGNKAAMLSLAWLQYHEAQNQPRLEDRLAMFDRAATWYRKLGAVDPRNKEAFYWLGVIDWLKAHTQLTQTRSQLHLEPGEEGPLPDDSVRRELQARIGPLYDDGIKQLTRALDIDPSSGDTMAFISLCMREKADLADHDDSYAALLKQADDWSEKSRAAKKARASSP